MHLTTTITGPDDPIGLPAFKNSGLTYQQAVAEIEHLYAADGVPDVFAPGWQAREAPFCRINTAGERAQLEALAATPDGAITIDAIRRRSALSAHGWSRGREFVAHLDAITKQSSLWACPTCSAIIAAPAPRCLPWTPLAPPPDGWQCPSCAAEAGKEAKALDRLRAAINAALEAARHTGESGPPAALWRELTAVKAAPAVVTVEARRLRARRRRIAALVAPYRAAIQRRAALRAFADVTPFIYRQNDLARLPAPDAYKRALAAVSPLAEGKRGLLAWAGTGSGKTRTLFAAARQLIRDGAADRVRIVAPAEIKAAAASGTWPDLRAELLDADVLVVDDLSHERFSEAYSAALLDLVEAVTAREHAPLLLASVQCTGRELIGKWCGRDADLRPTAEAIARRLAEFLVAVEFRPATTRPPRS